MKNKTMLIAGGIIVFVIILAVIGGSGSNNKTSDSSNTPAPSNAVDNQASTSADHVYSYVSSISKVLHSLYLSTQELNNAQSKYPTVSQEMQNATAGLQIDSDLSDAISILGSYTNDKNEAIKNSAGIIYLDVVAIKNANKVIMEEMRTATPETFNLQQAHYDIAQYAAAQNTLQKDLFQNNILTIITKGLIQIPVENNEATGQIKYSLSPNQRQDLIGEIQRAFGSVLDDYNKNTYVLAAKVLQLSLTFQTYEEQKNYKLQ
ncbi:MAG: hypothetical protein RL641_410 [Candidatus Parcubacteria bacterium]|jgi:hypothetical protein